MASFTIGDFRFVVALAIQHGGFMQKFILGLVAALALAIGGFMGMGSGSADAASLQIFKASACAALAAAEANGAQIAVSPFNGVSCTVTY